MSTHPTTTCFGSVGAAQIMRAAHRVGEGEGLEWWDKSGKRVLCLDDFGGTPGHMIWGVRTVWGGFDQTDRETARLILRGLLAPPPSERIWLDDDTDLASMSEETNIHILAGKLRHLLLEAARNGCSAENEAWRERLQELAAKRHSYCAAGETCNECMAEWLCELGVKP